MGYVGSKTKSLDQILESQSGRLSKATPGPLWPSCFLNHNFQTIKAINFTLQTLIARIVEKCSTLEPLSNATRNF